MNNLEMCKAFAELDGVKCHIYEGHLVRASRFNEVVNANCSGRLSHGMTQKTLHSAEFNPITDLALNCKARDDYEVQINYPCGDVSIKDNSGNFYEFLTSFTKKEGIPRAIIKCILKSKGLYNEKP